MEIFYYFYKTFICKTKSVTNFSVGPNHGMACRVSNHKMVGVQNHGINGIQTKEWPGFKTKRWPGFKTKGWSGFKSQRTLTTDYRSGHTTSIWQYRNCWRQIKQIWYVVYITFSRKKPARIWTRTHTSIVAHPDPVGSVRFCWIRICTLFCNLNMKKIIKNGF